ncbi:MAG TPA: ECF-type sigma factor [Gemmatimonadales bacterium]|nr:ECF-type sigma factor [Gemmatimonadales bacterium]
MPASFDSSDTDRLGALIRQADAGNRTALDQLFTTCYAELHRLAERHLRHQGDLTLGATTLLHEAYLNLAGRESKDFADRARFMAYVSRAMRGLVIDYARRRRTAKRGGQVVIVRVPQDEVETPAAVGDLELERLGAALIELEQVAPALAELVDLRFFGGFGLVEIARMQGSSERTLQREWRKARLLLAELMSTASRNDP